MEEKAVENSPILGDGLGPAPFIVEVGCVLTPRLGRDLPNASVLCFDQRVSLPEIPGENKRLRHVSVCISHRTDSFTLDNVLIQARALDHFWEEYRFPIDLLVCNVSAYPQVLLGGRRILFESRIVAVREGPDDAQEDIVAAMLPDFDRAPDRHGYLIYINKTF